MRVLQIVPTLGYGGVAQFLLNYYKLIDKSEIIFDFITHGGEEDFHPSLIKEGTHIFYLQSIGKSSLKAYKEQLKNVLTNNEYDIIHCHDGHITGFTAMLCKKYFSGPIICHAHTTLCPNPKHRPFMPLFRFMSRHHADVLLGCGELACQYLFGKTSQYTVIHNAVSVSRFNNITQEEVWAKKEELGIPSDAYVVGHVGAFCNQKNHSYLIDVFAKVRENMRNAYLILVGVGELMDDIQAKCTKLGLSEWVRFVGKQSNIPLFMHMFDVFVLPSHYEGLPVVAVEAQATGVHCVLADAIDHDVDAGIGIVEFVPTSDNDIQRWCDAICVKTDRASKAQILTQFVERGYEIESSVNSLVAQYRRVLSKNHK